MASSPITHLLPEDIVANILARLTVKSLKRFTCVGKSWRSLIQSPQFISAHYDFSKNKSSPLILAQHLPGRKEKFWSTSHQTLDIFANVDIPAPHDETKIYYNHIDVGGVDYDSTRDNYKIIRIDTYYDSNLGCFKSKPFHYKLVSVYDLAIYSWRKFNGNNMTAEFIGHFHILDQFYSNGFYHCFAAIENEEVILSFDMSNEVFITTPFPDDGGLGRNYANNTYYHTNNFMEINGTVGGIVCDDYYAIDKCYYVWVLGEVGSEEVLDKVIQSWTSI
ncbi:hypothetical protein PTKIN_Ptkin16aG0502900 [Pterospermum kingtungense]